MSDPCDPNEIPLLPEDWPSSPPPLADPVAEQLFLSTLPTFPATSGTSHFYPGQPSGGRQGGYRSVQPFPVEYASLLPVSATKPTPRRGPPAWVTVASLGLSALFAAALIVTNLPGDAADQPLPITGEVPVIQEKGVQGEAGLESRYCQ